MLLDLSPSRFARIFLLLILPLAICAPLSAQVALSAGVQTQSFDLLGSGLPNGWSVYTGATATTLGGAASAGTAAAGWADTAGGWKNVAARDNAGFTGTETTTVQAAAVDRALGIRQTGTFGDPGASANFYFSTLGLQVSSVSFSAQMLSVQTRSTTWSLQYGVGVVPASWTTIGTYSDPGAFGSATITGTGFGTALDNQSAVWLRIVALGVSTGSGSRDTFGIDDFTITTAAVGGSGAPAISAQPQPLTVVEGETATFSVTATGNAPLSYQWRKGTTVLTNNGIISGADTDTLTLTGVALEDAGNYNAIISNSVDSVTSNDAALTVNAAATVPIITDQPSSVTVPSGGTAIFSVAATGAAPLLYQWRKGEVNLDNVGVVSGATTSMLTLTSVSAADQASYNVVVTNSFGSVTSDSASLTVTAPPPSTGVIYWNFGTAAGVATPTGLPADVSGGAISRGNNNGTTTLLTTVSASAGYAESSGAFNAGAAARIGALILAADGSAYFELKLLPDSSKQLSITGISFGSRSTGTGPAQFSVYSSTDQFAQPVATGALSSLTWGLHSPVFTSVTGGTGDEVTLRIYGYGGAGSPVAGTANWRIDDLKLSINTVVGPPVPPVVTVTAPSNGASGIAETAPVSVTFNRPVILSDGWFTLTGSVSGAHPAEVFASGSTTYILTPLASFVEGETVTLTVAAAGVVDAATGSLHPTSDYTGTFSIITTRPIHTIQGSGLTSTYATQTVRVQGVVTATFQNPSQIGGYYIQSIDAEMDEDPGTSEGIYVFDAANPVAVGDLVTVTGTLVEFGTAPATETEISPVTVFTKNSSGHALPAAVAVSLPFPVSGYAERYEGMRVALPQSLTVTDTFDHGHFGELLLSNGRLPNPTNVVAPGAPAQAQLAANLLNQVMLDDGLSTTYPDPTPYLNSSDPAVATRRAGSTTTGVAGIFGNKFGSYVVEPTEVPSFVEANPRSSPPVVGGNLRVAIGNVLNYFNGNGAGGGFPTSRGADTLVEYQRQHAKIVQGILALAPDIMGLTEIENDGFGSESAIQDLVDGLNLGAPAGTSYAFVNLGLPAIGTDAITCGFIYKTTTVSLSGAAAVNMSSVFNRPPIAQTFREIATGEKLTVSINHFKSKGSPPAGSAGSNPDVDQGDGQGSWNALRTQQANALTAWLATHPTGDTDPDLLIVGDLNAYAKEDPITAIEAAGYANLTENFEGVGGYSYSFNGEFGHLDHALANEALAAQVVGAATWHANSDEPIYYDYNTEEKTAAQLLINAGTPYRYSDHDPVVVGINLTSPPAITLQPSSQTTSVGTSVTFTVTVTGTPAPTFQWRKNEIPIEGAMGASFTISSPVVADSGEYDVVVSNALDSVTSDPFTLTVNPVVASVTLGNLEQRYAGTARPVTATTNPAGLSVTITYDGSSTPPIYPGVYEVVGTVVGPDYFGSASDALMITTTVLVRHAPTLAGGLGGSVHQLLAESASLNGSAWVSGDLLVPGTPTVMVNGATYGGTIDASGSSTPSNFQITLNKGAVLRHVVRRVPSVTFPTVTAPPPPTGSRDVTLNSAGQSPGDFATVRNLTLNSKAGQVLVPPGTYGVLTANKNTGFTFGPTESAPTVPAVYNLQGLGLNSGSKLLVTGPVIIHLANGGSLSGAVGSPAHPEWLEVKIASGGLALMGDLSGSVMAPNGTVSVNGSATITGSVVSDQLTINSGGALEDNEP